MFSIINCFTSLAETYSLFSMGNKGKGFDFMFCSKDNKHSYFIPNEINWATTAL